MRYLLIITILLSFAMPVWAQGDDDPLYTIDSTGWFVVPEAGGEDTGTFYSTNEEIEPESGPGTLAMLSPGDLVVNIQVSPAEERSEAMFPTDPVFFLGFIYGVWFAISVFQFPDAVINIADVETVTLNGRDFYTSTFTIEDSGSIRVYAYVDDEIGITFDIYHTEDTDITPALELLETFELQLPE